MKKHEKKIGKRKSRQEILKNREKKKKKTLDKQGTMTTEGGKHTRKNQITGGFGKTFSSFQKIDHRKY